MRSYWNQRELLEPQKTCFGYLPSKALRLLLRALCKLMSFKVVDKVWYPLDHYKSLPSLVIVVSLPSLRI